MKNTNIVSVWQTLLSEGEEGAKAKASQYINESAARILKALTEEDVATVETTPSEGENLVTVTYNDQNGDCDFDDDVIAASGKDDYDSAGWAKGKRIISFLYDTEEEADAAIAQMGDLSDTVDGILINGGSSVTTDVSDEGDNVSVEVSPEETEVTEAEEENILSISFPSDGDSTVVDDFANNGFDIMSTDIIDDRRHIVFKFATKDEIHDAVPVVKDILRGFGIEDYSIDSDIESKSEVSADYADDGVVGEDADPISDTTDEDPQATDDNSSNISGSFDALASDLEDLRAQLEAAGITLSPEAEINGAGDEDSSDITGLDEAFLGYEDVKVPHNKDIATDTKSPLISTSFKDRLKPASPIKSPAGKLTGDGTKAETAPTVKETPATKNTVKGNVEKSYTKVSKEGDKSAKLNSKDGFGEDGKNSVID